MTITLIIIGAIALPFVIALFLKKEYHVQRQIILDKPQKDVFNYLKYLQNHEAFSPWSEFDPNMKRTFTGTDGEIGYTLRWESEHKKVGIGEQEISNIIPENRLEYKFRFYAPFKALKDEAHFQLSEIENSKTKIVWAYDGKLDYPGNLIGLFMNFDKMIGASFEKGLTKLKTII